MRSVTPSLRSGPLAGVRVVEFGSIGPGPMCAMLLADLGADVIRIDRTKPSELGIAKPDRYNLLHRNRRSIMLDLKHPEGVNAALALVGKTDALIEGFRPGTMERLGLGPSVCLQRKPALIYGRMTGWGQQGPLSLSAGHDLNYIALTGVLHCLGRQGERPALPLNLIGDYGGGALYLALGMVAALLEARGSGSGQVVDAAMIDGAASLMTNFFGLHQAGLYQEERGTNSLDGGAYYWDVYVCADNEHVAVAALEPKFRKRLLTLLGLDKESPSLDDLPIEAAREKLQAMFSTRPRQHWCDLLEGTDACFAPVLSLSDAPLHAHHRARGTFIEVDGIVQPAPAPRFSRTPLRHPTPPESPGASTLSALADWGFSKDEVAQWNATGVLGNV